MRRRGMVWSLVGILAVVGVAAGALIAGARPQLGLDLRGGISAIYSPVLPEGEPRPDDFDEVLDETVSVIRQRVDQLGVAEPDISRQGDDVLVQLPGLEDPERAREVIGTTAELDFRPVRVVVDPGSPAYAQLPDCPTAVDADEVLSGLSGVQPTPAPTATPGPGSASTPGDTARSTETPQSAPASVVDRDVVAAQQTATEAPSPTDGATEEPDEPAVVDLPGDRGAVVCGTVPEGADAPTGGPTDDRGGPLPPKYVTGPVALSGQTVDDAYATLRQAGGGGWEVVLELNGEGARGFAGITSQLACERDQGRPGLLAIVLDNRVESAPSMNPEVACGTGITGGQASITVGQGDQAEQESEARDLALVLKTGSLPITLEPSTFQTISPTLGTESLQAGVIAAGIGLALVALYLLFFYRWLGLVAIGQLTIFGVLMYGLITLLGEVGFALTLAGIAGIVVSIGITADSSIIFFERIRDEVGLGKTVRTGVQRAFERAFRTNLAGNTVTLAAALILYFLAVGPVRGFALTLGFATVLDIVILYLYTRSTVGLLSRGTRLLSRRSMRVAAAEPAEGGAQ